MTELLGECSQNNSLVKHLMGLYLYATGAQRQLMSVLSTLGICSSYPSIAGSGGALVDIEGENRRNGDQLGASAGGHGEEER